MSYIINAICGLLHIQGSLSCVAFAAIASYLFTQSVQADWAQTIFDMFKIRKSVKSNIWCELIQTEKSNYVKIFDDTGFYCGTCVAYEDDAREPYIILTGYERCDLDGNTLSAADLSGSRRMIFSLKDFKRVEVVYDSPVN